MFPRWTASEWHRAAPMYSALTRGDVGDSRFLRERYLFPTLLDLVKKSEGSKVLDLGAGDGSLARLLPEYEIFPADIIADNLLGQPRASLHNAEGLGFRDKSFDVAVLSLVLMWIPTLDAVCSEVRRVATIGGSVVVVLVSPYFYRTGYVTESDCFVLTEDLSRPFVLRDLRIANYAGPLTYYYRPPHDYINALVGAGLEIKEVSESFIDMTEYNALISRPDSVPRRSGRVPIYSFIRCVRAE